MSNNNIEKLVDIMKNGRNCNLMMGHIMGSDIRYFASELVKNDVVPVIRCKDCEHLKRNSLYAWCEPKSTIWDKYIVQPDNFCCWGKRKGS